MAIEWKWNERVGTIVYEERYDEVKRFTYNLYKGNAYLIMIDEWEQDGESKYCIQDFFLDKQHMMEILGLDKKGGNIDNRRNRPKEAIVAINLDKGKLGAKQTVEIATAFSKAFDNITIKVYTDSNGKESET